jgi:hypothetical protein
MKKIEYQNRIEQRKQRVTQLCAQFQQNGYHLTDLTISAAQANTLAMITAILPSALYLLLFGFAAGWESFKNIDTGLLAISLLLSIVIHELIHGFFFGLFAPHHYSSIEFGILWRSLNPYCYCAEPVSRIQYLVALLMPGFVLGTCIGAIAIWAHSATWLVFSIVSYFSASGDFMVAYKLIRFHPNEQEALFLDHPNQPGVLAFTRPM